MQSLQICNVSTLVFNNPPVIHNKFSGPYIPDHSLHIAYGPHLTKCGSTSALKMLKRVGKYLKILENVGK